MGTTDYNHTPDDKLYYVDAVVPNSGTTPAAGIDLRGVVLVGLRLPAGAEGTTITFTASDKLTGSYEQVKSSDGSVLSITNNTGADHFVLDPANFASVGFIKPVMDSQTGDITLVLVVRKLK